MRPLILLALTTLLALPLACGNNLSNPTTATTNTTATATITATATPNGAGVTWISATSSASFSTRLGPGMVTYSSYLWVIGGTNASGYYNDVWYSSNGYSWTQQLANTNSPGSNQFIQRSQMGLLNYNNALWVIGGLSSIGSANDVWSSTNGSTWTQKLTTTSSPGSSQFSQRFSFTALVYNSAMWVIGGSGSGTLNDVWSSTDGITWNQQLANNSSPGPNQFPQRTGLASTVYNNQMWIIGGYTGAVPMNDVWSSSNGTTWTQVLADNSSPGTNQFPQRTGHQLLVYDNLLWVIGGYTGSASLNDVWYSSNGVTWTQALANTSSPGLNQFSERRVFGATVFNNLMWLVGGYFASTSTYYNDVWYSP